MRTVFVDTLYWIALLVASDPWKAKALAARSRLGEVRLLTTEEVFLEVLTALSGLGTHYRQAGVQLVEAMRRVSEVEVAHQSHVSFDNGLGLYRMRPDKSYSMVDCISMVTMRQRGITEILTNDHHFEQEGFVVLIR
ncbi:MAG: PIN domain-containing protein [Armatimonadetes bacterium]|nr:PIN domain-containing protein [Armatimonadota bacterium]